jgi:hypothetical protein
MERMQTHSDVELVLAAVLDEVLVAANAASLKGLGGQLFILVGHEMHAEGEVFDMSPWSRGHHDRNDSWGMACSCSSGN